VSSHTCAVAPRAPYQVTLLRSYRDRYSQWCDDSIPKFHYGSHYSTPSYVIFFLIRLEPCAPPLFLKRFPFSLTLVFFCRFTALHVQPPHPPLSPPPASPNLRRPGATPKRPLRRRRPFVPPHGGAVERQHAEHGRRQRTDSRVLLPRRHVFQQQLLAPRHASKRRNGF